MNIARFLIILCVVTFGLPGFGRAQTTAKQAFEQAELHYKLGRFAQALTEYSRAYELAPLPGFLFNIGQCHRQLGHHERAVFFFRGYLREKPGAKNQRVVKELIAQSRKIIQQEQSQQKKKANLARQQLETRRDQEHQLAMEQARLAALTATEQAVPIIQPAAFYQRWWFWTIVGGVLLTAGGTAWALSVDGAETMPQGSLGLLDLRGP